MLHNRIKRYLPNIKTIYRKLITLDFILMPYKIVNSISFNLNQTLSGEFPNIPHCCYPPQVLLHFLHLPALSYPTSLPQSTDTKTPHMHSCFPVCKWVERLIICELSASYHGKS